jgi:hypothetical protein
MSSHISPSAAVRLTGPAGWMSFHRVWLLHGSAQNVSSLPRTLLLHEYGAADAWPLMGVSDLTDFDGRLIARAVTIEPPITPAPMRLPQPPALHQESIHENQFDAGCRYFAMTEDAAPAPRP